MTNHPAMFDTSPDETKGATRPSASKTQPSLKTMLLRAVVVGLFGGVALIGLIENVDRFSDPAAIHAERNAQTGLHIGPADTHPAGLQDRRLVESSRANRLDYSLVPATTTDVATR